MPPADKIRKKRDITEIEDRFFSSHVAYSIIALANLITQNTLKNILPGSDLSVNEWRILRMTFIYQSICAIDVINIFGLDKTTTSRAIRRLHDAGLIKLRRDAADRRQTNFLLTAKGKRLHDKIIRHDDISDNSIETALTKTELRTFHRIMKKLRVQSRQMLKDDR